MKSWRNLSVPTVGKTIFLGVTALLIITGLLVQANHVLSLQVDYLAAESQTVLSNTVPNKVHFTSFESNTPPPATNPTQPQALGNSTNRSNASLPPVPQTAPSPTPPPATQPQVVPEPKPILPPPICKCNTALDYCYNPKLDYYCVPEPDPIPVPGPCNCPPGMMCIMQDQKPLIYCPDPYDHYHSASV